MTHRDERGGFFTLMLYPPEDLEQLKRAPMEMVFVLDCSGSMNGQPIDKAKAAVERALRKLEPDDTFQIIQLLERRLAARLDSPSPRRRRTSQRASSTSMRLQGEGGTMMIEGIKAALDFPHDPQRLRFVSFLTDGYIGNEAEILGEIHKRLGAARIFSFGVGSSVNRYLLDGMAQLGNGAVAYLGLNDSGTEVMDLFFDRISHPALTDVADRLGRPAGLRRLPAPDPRPLRRPADHPHRPIPGPKGTAIRIAGRVGEYEKEIRIPVNLDGRASTHPGIACVWARKKIDDLAITGHLQCQFLPARRDQAGRPRIRPDVRLHRLRRGRFHPDHARRPRRNRRRPRPGPRRRPLRNDRAGLIYGVWPRRT